MAHFYITAKGSRGETSRCGTKNSGMTAHARGWSKGVEVCLTYNSETGEDVITIYKTGGSNNLTRELVAEI